MQVLQRQPGRTVVLEAGGQVVRKTFHGDDAGSLEQLATREFERMVRFSTALADVTAVTCPTPIELGAGPEPYVRMGRAAGVPMQSYLGTTTVDAERSASLADALGRGLIRYVETFAEPYWDFILRNMFYDERTGLVTLLDFGVPVIYAPALADLERHSPFDVSLGGLVASSVFEAARPKRFWRRLEHRQAFSLASAVTRRLLETPGAPGVTPVGVRTVAEVTYGLAETSGGRLLQGWYRLCGSKIAGRDRKFARAVVE
jgi:hypothetical protein